MIWLIQLIDQAFIDSFATAGEPDQRMIDAYLQNTKAPIYTMKNQGKRWYYLHKENQRISLATIGRPLDDWRGAAKLIIGTREIIGEFPGNAQFIGLKGLQIKCEPGEWLRGQPDRIFENASQILAEISEQILDRKEIERSQQKISEVYRWN